MRIFVVENHPDTLKYLKMYLESIGHSVTTACTIVVERMLPETGKASLEDIGRSAVSSGPGHRGGGRANERLLADVN